jgi:hypothetical protein
MRNAVISFLLLLCGFVPMGFAGNSAGQTIIIRVIQANRLYLQEQVQGEGLFLWKEDQTVKKSW